MRYSLIIILLLACCRNEEPANEGYADIAGTKIYYHIIGEGEPLMVLHGGPVMDQSYLTGPLGPLTKKYKLIFADQRACGKSSADVDSTTMSMHQLVEDIEQLRIRLNLGKIHLLGHSWGGFLAAKYAIAYPQNLRSLILSEPMPPSTELWSAEENQLMSRITQEDSIRQMDILQSEQYKLHDASAVTKLMRIAFRSQFYDTTKIRQLNLTFPTDYFARSATFSYIAPELMNFNILEDLPKISCPTLIVYGDYEPAAELGGKAYAEAIPDSKLVIIPHSGHFPFIENPEIYFSDVTNFLDGK